MRELLLAAASLAGSSCVLPDYGPVGSCRDEPETQEPFARVLSSTSWADIDDFDGDPCTGLYGVGGFAYDVQFDTSLAFSGDAAEVHVTRFQPNGDYAWVRTIGGQEDQFACCAASLEDGVVVGGHFEIALEFGSQALFTPGAIDQFHGYLVKLTADGDLANAVWLSTTGEVRVSKIDSGADGRVAVGGRFRNTLSVEGTGVSLSGDGTFDGFVLVFDQNLALLWSDQISADADEEVTGVAFADDGTLLVAGTTSSEPFWQSYSVDGTAANDEVRSLVVGGGGEQAHVVPLAGGEFLYVLLGGEYISDGTMEWPLTGNLGVMRLDREGGVQWHMELPDVEPEGIELLLGDVHHDPLTQSVHIVGGIHGGQAQLVQDGQVAVTLDPPPVYEERDAMMITLDVDSGFHAVTLLGDVLRQEAHAVFGADGQLFLAGEFEASFALPSGQSVTASSDPDGFVARFEWP